MLRLSLNKLFIISLILVFPMLAGAQNLINAWHIPANNEPPSVTMRNPLFPDDMTDKLYIYVGAYPLYTLESGTLYIKEQSDITWNTVTFAWDSNQGSNEYWRADYNHIYSAGDTVQYFIKVTADSNTLYDTYIYYDTNDPNASTADLNVARSSPYSYMVTAATPTPVSTETPTPQSTSQPTITPTAALINAWHIPDNNEPPGVTMRNPLDPKASDNKVYIYVGAYPQSTIYSGSLHYKLEMESTWNESSFAFDSNNGGNEYWLANFNMTYSDGDRVQYYIKLTEDAGSFFHTFVYDLNNTSSVTSDSGIAVSSPFEFTVSSSAPTPTPSTTPTLGLINAWHIPANNEPPAVTMRNPLDPKASDLKVYIYVGAFPQSTIYSGYLYYKLDLESVWSESSFSFDSNNGNNEYWIANFNMAYSIGDNVQYYIMLSGDPGSYSDTYIYDLNTSSVTSDPGIAAGSPFEFTVLSSTPSPTPSITPTPSLMNVWHIPSATEPPSVTMRNPLDPDRNTGSVYIYTGGQPQGTIDSGNLYYKGIGDLNWQMTPLSFDSNNGNNEYWVADFALRGHFSVGTSVQYYIECDSAGFTTTYIYEYQSTPLTTGQQSLAETNPFFFQILDAVTFTPTPTGIPSTPTPTNPGNLMDVWHIPENNEPTSVTMRNPLNPDMGTQDIYLYLGGYPQHLIHAADVYYKRDNDINWSMVAFSFDTNEAANEYWRTQIANSFATSDTVQYYISAYNPSYDRTYVYGTYNQSHETADENAARNRPYSFTLDPAPTATPLPLLNIWHIPANQEPPGVTMRNPVQPNYQTSEIFFYMGLEPQGTVDNAWLYFKRAQDLNWSHQALSYDSFHDPNEYWITSLDDTQFTLNNLIQYYIKAEGPNALTTYIYGDNFSHQVTDFEGAARNNPFSFRVHGTPTPTPTATATHTETPLPPTETPTPRCAEDKVYLGGYWNTDLHVRQNGELVIQALVPNCEGTELELYYQNTPTGVKLYDDGTHGDIAAGDCLFGLSLQLAGRDMTTPLKAAMEIVVLCGSDAGPPWPYLNVE